MNQHPKVETVKKKKIAIYYPFFTGGGAEAVALWMLEALQTKYELTLFTISEIDFPQLNSMYGTNLSRERVSVKTLLPKFWGNTAIFLISNNKDARQLSLHLLLRFFKAHKQDYDLVVSAYNAADLGKKGLQYIHWVKVIEGKKKIYQQISNFSLSQLQANISLANSHTVAAAVKQSYGIESEVVYPPVVLKVSEIPWENKENAFICSGRLVKAKQPHKAITVLKQVRDRGFDVKLYLTGGGGGIYEWKYQRFLKKMVAANSSWVKLYENLAYEDYSQILYQCKYGIHLKSEPFGISIAEMVKAGAIPFVKKRGGQVEIVGKDNTDLLFDKEQDAVEKIVAVLSSPERQQKLLESLAQEQLLFSTDRFMNNITKVVDRYFTEDD